MMEYVRKENGDLELDLGDGYFVVSPAVPPVKIVMYIKTDTGDKACNDGDVASKIRE